MQAFTLPDLLLQNLPERGQHQAVVQGQESLDYSELAERVRTAAGRLSSLGLQKGDRVGVHLVKSIDEIVAVFAVSSCGGVIVNLNAQLTVSQVARALHVTRARLLITSARRAAALLRGSCPDTLERMVVVDRAAGDRPHARLSAWSDLDQRPVSAGARLVDRDRCAIIYTSGSTGPPKGVVLTHGMVVQSARVSVAHLKNCGGDRLLGVLPLSFDFGLNQLTSAMLVGGTLVLPRAALPVELLRAVLDNRVDGLAMTPTLWIPFVRLLEGQGTVLDQVRYVANSGGALPSEIRRAWPRVFPAARHYLMYGMTEGFRSSYLPPEDFHRKPGSIGVPLPNVDLFVVDPEHGLCGPNVHGELIHRGSLISSGYYNDALATSAKIRPCAHLAHVIGDEPVLYSGDTVYKDDDGYLWFVARTSSLIKCSDFRISPTEVEDIVFSSGLVTDVVAFGVADELLGQVVHVAVTSLDGQPLDRAALHDYCRRHMPSYMWPRQAHLWEGEMPRTPSGKLDRPQIIQRCVAVDSNPPTLGTDHEPHD